MAPGFVIAQIDVTDPERYKDYVAAVGATVEKFGGVYIARGGESETVEGEIPGSRSVIIRFPSYQAARDWYHSPEYSGVKTIRQEASTGAMTIVEGLE